MAFLIAGLGLTLNQSKHRLQARTPTTEHTQTVPTPSPGTPGTDETYTLQVTNKGPDAAENVIVKDRLPAGLSFVSASPGCEEIESAH